LELTTTIAAAILDDGDSGEAERPALLAEQAKSKREAVGKTLCLQNSLDLDRRFRNHEVVIALPATPFMRMI
jgi:hypothetical protein